MDSADNMQSYQQSQKEASLADNVYQRLGDIVFDESNDDEDKNDDNN